MRKTESILQIGLVVVNFGWEEHQRLQYIHTHVQKNILTRQVCRLTYCRFIIIIMSKCPLSHTIMFSSCRVPRSSDQGIESNITNHSNNGDTSLHHLLDEGGLPGGHKCLQREEILFN